MQKSSRDLLLEQYARVDTSIRNERSRFTVIALMSFIVFGVLGIVLKINNPSPVSLEEKISKIKTSFVFEEKKQLQPQKEPPKPKIEEKKPKPVPQKEPIDLTKNPPIEKKAPERPPEEEPPQPKDAPPVPVRKVYGLRKVYSTGIGASGGAEDAIIGKLGNTINTEIDTFKATAEELRGRVVSVATVTTPPVRKVIVKPEYTKEMLENKVEGVVKVKILIDTDGKVKKVIVLNDLGFGTKEKVYEACLKLLFEPAKLNGEPVAVWESYSFRFEIQG